MLSGVGNVVHQTTSQCGPTAGGARGPFLPLSLLTPLIYARYVHNRAHVGLSKALHRWSRPPLAHCGRKKILVETLSNAAHPTKCRHSLNSVRLIMVCCFVQCLHCKDFLRPHCAGGGPGHLSADLCKRR